jgi:hypothetical protein
VKLKERLKEDHLHEGKERFVTSAYKDKLQRDSLWLAEQSKRDADDAAHSAQAHGDMTAFYRNLLEQRVGEGEGGDAKRRRAQRSRSRSPRRSRSRSRSRSPRRSQSRRHGESGGGGAEAEAARRRKAQLEQELERVRAERAQAEAERQKRWELKMRRRNDDAAVEQARQRFLARRSARLAARAAAAKEPTAP